jgi:asparagine synthase (glutamine-hydrolysing)
MCGIAGIISADSSLVTKENLSRMTDAIAHRGPDGEQQWVSLHSNAGLGHRRLAILDLSSAAIQPMHYLDRYTIVFNGEIYNYIELRSNLEQKGYRFQSKSDTEVILATYAMYGYDCCSHLDGMFAFAIWDEKNQELFAARDRFGEKPLYYVQLERGFLFASEIKAISALTGVGGITGIGGATGIGGIRSASIINFLTLGNSRIDGSSGDTIYTNVRELPPASQLVFRIGNKSPDVKQYWKLANNTDYNLPEKAVFETFNDLWNKSLSLSLRSDVPIGCSLSGGLDSSSIVAGIYNKIAGRLNTYSAVFPGYQKDESPYIDLVATRYKCQAHHTSPDGAGLRNDISKLIWHQETFVSSASAYAQYSVFKLARETGTVVMLDGQGADEILGGYSKHIQWALQELYRKPPLNFRESMIALKANGASFEWTWKHKLAGFLPVLTATILRQRELQRIRRSGMFTRDFLAAYDGEKDLPAKPIIRKLNDILYYDTTRSGLNELLHYADRNSMAHGREVRLPFLNHHLVSFLFTLPAEFRFRDGWTKWILRKSMENILPGAIAWRKDKIGFEPPQARWMENSSMQEMIREAKTSLVNARILNARVLHKKIQPLESHAAENFDWRFLVTDLLLKQSHSY